LSTIAPYVQHLDVIRTYGGGGISWFTDVLPRLAIFTAVQSTTLTLANFVPLEEGLTPVFATFQLLTHLGLDRCRFKSFAQFADVMCGCPNLESFASIDLTWSADDAFSYPTHLKPSRHPQLRTLNLCGDGKGAVLNWLRLGQSPPRITELVITLIHWEDAKYIGAFLRVLGSSLMHLEVDVRSDTAVSSVSSLLLAVFSSNHHLLEINSTALP
jgi:hypothetical protein